MRRPARRASCSAGRRHGGGATGLAAGSAAFLASRQSANGGFAEQGRAPDGPLDRLGGARARRGRRLRRRSGRGRSSSSAPIRRTARPTATSLFASSRSRPSERRSTTTSSHGSAGTGRTSSSTRRSGPCSRCAPPASSLHRRSSSAILAAQARGGGFPWSRGGSPDSNDTAAAIQALRAAGVGGASDRRAPWPLCAPFRTATAASR